jgi:hypothetical protein
MCVAAGDAAVLAGAVTVQTAPVVAWHFQGRISVMNRTVVALFIFGLLIFLATVAFLWQVPDGAVPEPPARQAASIDVAPNEPSDEAKRIAEARRVNAEAAAARERRDDRERELQARYQDDARQLQQAQERRVEQRLRAAEQAAAQQQRLLREEQLAQARRIAADQAARETERQRQLAAQQQERAWETERVRRMMEQEWLYWRYPMPILPAR